MTPTTRPQFPFSGLLHASCLAALALGALPAQAMPAARHADKTRADLIGDFRALAQQTPWECPAAPASGGTTAGPGGKAACAWQNRLRRQSWSWNDDGTPACLSRQARWWNQAQAALPAATPRSVWDARWNAQVLQLRVGEEQRLLLVQRDDKGRWQATEWRWNPNPRPATRRWQEGRWKQLVEATSQPRYKGVAADLPDTLRTQPVLRRVLGARPGEFHRDGLRFESAGRCLQASNPLPGQPKLHLSYSPNDSRLEQRAAMHLQLSRQHPEAKWLTQFKMLEMPAGVPSGAKFLATWVEDRQVVGQLWMPGKGDAGTVRLRVSAGLPRGGEATAAAAKLKPAIEDTLEAIALQWAAAYE